MSNLDSTTPGVASGITSSGLLLTNCIYCDGDVLIPTPWTVYLDQDNPPIYEGFFYMENSMYGTLGAGEFTIQYRTLRLV